MNATPLPTVEHHFPPSISIVTLLFVWIAGTGTTLAIFCNLDRLPTLPGVGLTMIVSLIILAFILRYRVTITIRADENGIAIIQQSILKFFTRVEFHPAGGITSVRYLADFNIDTSGSSDVRYIQYDLTLQLTDGKIIRVYSERDKYVSREFSAKLAKTLKVAYVETLPELPRDIPYLASRQKRK